MEYTAKITQEQKIKNDCWQYSFLDVQTKEEDFFYHHSLIDYIPSLSGRLKLFFDDQNQCKLYQSFEQNLEEEEILAQFTEHAERGNEKLESNPLIRKVKLTPEFLNKLHYVDKYKWKTIAKIYGVSVWTLQRIRKGRKSLKQKAGRKRKIEGCDLALLLAHIKKNNTATQQVRADYFAKRCILLNRSTIFRTLKREGWTRKIGTKQYFELDIEKARQFLTDNYQLFSSPSCYALDECGFDLREFARYAYSRKGLQAIIKQPGQKGSNLSVILCVQNTNKEPVISYRPVEGGVDAEIFYDFLSNVNFSTNQEDCILLDNAKIHHANKKLKDLGLLSIKELAKLKNITLKYLPSYAPMLNPAELCIQFIKRHVRSCKPKNREEMKYFIEEAIGLLNQHLTKFFRSCRDYFYFAKNEQ